MPERHDILPNRSKASYSDPTRHGYPDPHAPGPRKCPACNGNKFFCERCWRPMGEGDCKRCKRGDACRTCAGVGHLSGEPEVGRCMRCGKFTRGIACADCGPAMDREAASL